MILSDLRKEIALLNGGMEIADDLLILSLNHALRRLYTDRSIERRVRITANVNKPISYYKEIHLKSGQLIELPLVGIAYSMRLLGTGSYMINDGESVKADSITNLDEPKTIRGFISVGGKITFWSSFSFTIYDLAMYDSVSSHNVENIPLYEARKTFDLRKIYDDFLCFVSPATDKDGKPIKGCILRDGGLEIDSDYTGEILLTYRRLPKQITNPESKEEIDVPKEYTHLLTLLTAFYCWFQTDEALAKHYLAQYEDGVEAIERNCYERIDPSYVNTNGWA